MNETKPLIVWSDPPKGRQAKAPHAHYVEALHERPGKWAQLRRNPSRKPLDNLANSLRRNPSAYARLAHPYQLEVTVRLTESGDYGLWARLVERKQ